MGNTTTNIVWGVKLHYILDSRIILDFVKLFTTKDKAEKCYNDNLIRAKKEVELYNLEVDTDEDMMFYACDYEACDSNHILLNLLQLEVN